MAPFISLMEKPEVSHPAYWDRVLVHNSEQAFRMNDLGFRINVTPEDVIRSKHQEWTGMTLEQVYTSYLRDDLCLRPLARELGYSYDDLGADTGKSIKFKRALEDERELIICPFMRDWHKWWSARTYDAQGDPERSSVAEYETLEKALRTETQRE